MTIIKDFFSSIVVSILGFLIGVYLYPNNIPAVLYSIVILALLEISLSFDNAIINAKTLEGMSIFWQKMFIIIGMPIAVFGMRLVFPILLVSMTSSLGFVDVFHLATTDPQQYHHILESSMPLICSFGGAFLLMVFLNFFLSENEDYHWIPVIENNIIIRNIKSYDGGYIVFAIIIGFVVILKTPSELQGKIALAFLLG